MNIKKYTEKDRYGNMFSYEFDVPSMQEIPNPEIFKPKGTDTVPAMLTPGENVVNAEASRLPGVQPMLDKLNDKGRAIQKKQGGPIPSYNSEGGQIDYYGNDYNQSTVNSEISTLKGMGLSDSQIIQALMNNLNMSQGEAQAALMPAYKQDGGVITEDMMPSVLDAMREVESGGDVNAVSEVGAAGPYQIMKATALKPGYGVEAISGADRFNEVKSRGFAKQYLQGIMKAHPEFTKDQVLTAYHSGVGNVLKAKSGEEELGPRGQAYAGKIADAIPTTKIITLDGRPIEPGFMSAQASTTDTSNKGVPDYIKGIPPEDISTDTSETGLGNQIMNKLSGGEFDFDKAFGGKEANPFNTDTTLTDIYNTITDAPGEIYDIIKGKATEVSRAKDLKKAKQFLVDADKNVEYYKEKFDNEPNAANEKKLKDAIKAQKKILKIVEKRTDSVEKFTSDKEKEKKKYEKKSSEDIVNEKKNKNEVVKKIIQDTNTADYGEGKLSLDEADEAWAKKNLTGEYEGDFSQYLINKGKEYGGVILDKSMEYFKNAFSSMFDGEELARMALIYAGSRAMGYNHGGSLNYSMKNYMKRVDANQAYAKKAVLDKDFAEKYTPESLLIYAKTADMNDLIPATKKISMKTSSGSGYLRGLGKVPKFKDKDGIEYARIGKDYVPTSQLYIEEWDDSAHGDAAVTKQFDNYGEAIHKSTMSGIESTDSSYSAYRPMGSEANSIYRKILRSSGRSINEAPQLKMAIERAMVNFYEAKALNKKDSDNIKPYRLEQYVQLEMFTPLTGIGPGAITGTSPDNLALLDKQIKKDMDIKSPKDKGYNDEYKAEWKAAYDAWGQIPQDERDQAIANAAEKKKDDNNNGWSGFTLWAYRTPSERINELIK